jgi:hypothetical protein
MRTDEKEKYPAGGRARYGKFSVIDITGCTDEM